MCGIVIVEHNCTIMCLPPRQNNSDSDSKIMHAVDDDKDNELNDYKMLRHESIDKYFEFMEEQFQEFVAVDERTLPVELPAIV